MAMSRASVDRDPRADRRTRDYFLYCPIPMRVSGDSTVASASACPIRIGWCGQGRLRARGDHVRQGTGPRQPRRLGVPFEELAAAQARYSEATTAIESLPFDRRSNCKSGHRKGEGPIIVNARLTHDRNLLDRTP